MLHLHLKILSFGCIAVGMALAALPQDIISVTNGTSDNGLGCANFNTTYNSCNFNHDVNITSAVPCIFNCSYNPSLLSPLQLDVHLKYKQSSKHPTFITAEQNLFLNSWTLPKMFPNHGEFQKYTSVAGLLCPPFQQLNETVQVRITTSSPEVVTINVRLHNQSYALKLGDIAVLKTTPVSPDYRLYQWMGEQTSVLVSVESKNNSDTVCAIFALQNAKCPVVTDESGLRAGSGRFQTFTKQAAMVARRSDFPDGIHMIVWPLPDDDRCTLSLESMSNHSTRSKSVQFEIFKHSTIESTWYIFLATGGLTAGMIFTIALLTLKCIDRTLNGTMHALPLAEDDERELLPEDDFSGTSRGQYAESGVAVLSGVDSGMRRSGSGYSQLPEAATGQASDSGFALSFQSESATSNEPSSREIVPQPYYPPTTVAPPNNVIQEMTSSVNPVYVMWWKRYAEFESTTAEAQVSEMGFQHNILIMAVFAMLPTTELIRSYWKVLSYNGDEDQCFFNSRCLTGAWIFHDFARVFTNIGYICGGIAFSHLVLRHKQSSLKNLSQLTRRNNVGVSRHYGLFISLGYGLIIQGLMSSLYHTCPNSVTIRFDMMFMYVMVVASVICVWGLRHGDVTHHVYPTMGLIGTMVLLAEGREWVSRLTFWLCMSFMYLFLLSTTTLLMSRYGIWSFSPMKMLQVWKGWKPVRDKLAQVIRNEDLTSTPLHVLRIVVGIVANVSLILYGAIADPNVYGYILSICLTNLGLYFGNYVITKRIQYKERGTVWAWICLALSFVLWILALSAFCYHITDSEASAADSRSLNSSCAFFGVFDTHDVWHLFSSLALYTFFIGLLTLDDDMARTPSAQIHVF
ncbi:SID1 transmembrane family member 2-like [Palaemon carinicauda]|uniref:SID1 transmembrane family member 2-like n=1 Tax=Palaemon carinicauda TaxID=392227 RepID=UPI0035B620D6